MPFCSLVILNASQNFAGPFVRLESDCRAIRRFLPDLFFSMTSTPPIGSTALINTASPLPAFRVTTLAQKCIPYVKYT